jgi:hypothetical protein
VTGAVQCSGLVVVNWIGRRFAVGFCDDYVKTLTLYDHVAVSNRTYPAGAGRERG